MRGSSSWIPAISPGKPMAATWPTAIGGSHDEQQLPRRHRVPEVRERFQDHIAVYTLAEVTDDGSRDIRRHGMGRRQLRLSVPTASIDGTLNAFRVDPATETSTQTRKE